MAATFDASLSGPVDRMRHAVGDTDVTVAADALRQDETYEAYLGFYSVSLAATAPSAGEWKATRDMLRALAAEVAQDPDTYGSPTLRVQWGERIKTWLSLADTLDKQIALVVGNGAVVGSQIPTRGVYLTEAEFG
jgi:hypothetical protein